MSAYSKTIISISTSLFLLFLLLCGCTQNSTVNKTTSITIATGGNTDYRLVCNNGLDEQQMDLYTQFSAEISKRAGASLLLYPDTQHSDNEILLGAVDRQESVALRQALQAKGGDRFGIFSNGSVIAIYGTNMYQTYLALDYFMKTYISTDESGNVTLRVPSQLQYISDENGCLNGVDIPSLVQEHDGFFFMPGKAILHVPSQGQFTSTQGCGYDGTYIYVGKIDSSPNDPEHGKILKYRMDTGELVAVSEALPTNHTNDICYDPTTGLLIVTGANGTGKYMGGKLISFVDPETLTMVKSLIGPMYMRSVEYCPELDVYIVAGGDGARSIFHFDKDFNEISSFKQKGNNYTVQAVCTDGKYVYDPRYLGKTSEIHYMNTHTLDGEFIGEIPIYNLQGEEPESMFIADGKFYLCCGISNIIYELEMLPNTYWK